MPGFIRELDDLVFDGRAVTHSGGFDYPGIKRRFIQIVPDYFMGPGVGIGNVAGDLFLFDRLSDCSLQAILVDGRVEFQTDPLLLQPAVNSEGIIVVE